MDREKPGELRMTGEVSQKKWWRLPLLALGMVSLVSGIWGGLIRMPLNLPLPTEHANWLVFHGALMVSGFLGTLIGLERAVGVGKGWAYLAPICTGLGAVILVFGGMGASGPALLVLGSVIFAGVCGLVILRLKALFTITMGVAGALWVMGNALWMAGLPVPRMVLWWGGFLLLTIVAERLELTRFQRPRAGAKPLFMAAAGIFVAGLAWSLFHGGWGERMAGLGMLALAIWLWRFDIAHRTLRQEGLPRFTAVCLLSGYFWLAVSGILLVISAPLQPGFRYDAVLHAFFLGFVFSMIFGHAPIIFPAVLNCPIPFRKTFYAHAGLLHLSLGLRIASDLGSWEMARQWGGILNAISIAAFFLNTIGSFLVWKLTNLGEAKRERELGAGAELERKAAQRFG